MPSKASEASNKTNIAELKERMRIAVENAKIEAYEEKSTQGRTGTIVEIIIAKIKARFTTNPQLAGFTVTVSDEGEITAVRNGITLTGTMDQTSGIITWSDMATGN